MSGKCGFVMEFGHLLRWISIQIGITSFFFILAILLSKDNAKRTRKLYTEMISVWGWTKSRYSRRYWNLKKKKNSKSKHRCFCSNVKTLVFMFINQNHIHKFGCFFLSIQKIKMSASNKTLQMKIVFASFFRLASASTSFSFNSFEYKRRRFCVWFILFGSLWFASFENCVECIVLFRVQCPCLFVEWILFFIAVKCVYSKSIYEKHQCVRVRSLMMAHVLVHYVFRWYVMHKTIQCIKMPALITKNALLNAYRCAFERERDSWWNSGILIIPSLVLNILVFFSCVPSQKGRRKKKSKQRKKCFTQNKRQ